MKLTLGRTLLVFTLALPFVPVGPAGLAALGAQGGRSTFVAGVADAETGQPLEGAEVILLGEHRLARANALGEATLTDVPRGRQRVRVRRLGYGPVEIDVAMMSDTTGAVFRLEKSPVVLGAVKVEAEAVPTRMKDFMIRKRQAIGRFLTDTDLDHDRDRDFLTMMPTRVPGLKTVIDDEGHRVLASTRDVYTLTGVAPCYTTVYLDDIMMERQDVDMIRTWDLAGVEYYTGAEVPVRYRTHAYGCGVLLLWSKWY